VVLEKIENKMTASPIAVLWGDEDLMMWAHVSGSRTVFN
jgi:hypothetical protein